VGGDMEMSGGHMSGGERERCDKWERDRRADG
jgi:hypothetical protein